MPNTTEEIKKPFIGNTISIDPDTSVEEKTGVIEEDDLIQRRKKAVLAALQSEELLRIGVFPGYLSETISVCRSFLLSVAQLELTRLQADGIDYDPQAEVQGEQI